jgi:DNA-binding NarL/FixJ family response regulator
LPRLFLCDDDANYRTLVNEVLNLDDDLEIVGQACDGRECVDRVAAAGADVVLLDINMPIMTGFEALPLLREAAPDAKVFVLSSASSETAESTAMALGADAFIQKPYNIMDLAGQIRASLAATA